MGLLETSDFYIRDTKLPTCEPIIQVIYLSPTKISNVLKILVRKELTQKQPLVDALLFIYCISTSKLNAYHMNQINIMFLNYYYLFTY